MPPEASVAQGTLPARPQMPHPPWAPEAQRQQVLLRGASQSREHPSRASSPGQGRGWLQQGLGPQAFPVLPAGQARDGQNRINTCSLSCVIHTRGTRISVEPLVASCTGEWRKWRIHTTVSGLRARDKSKELRSIPGGAVVKNLPGNAGDAGSIPGLGSSHMPRNNEASAPQLLSLSS